MAYAVGMATYVSSPLVARLSADAKARRAMLRRILVLLPGSRRSIARQLAVSPGTLSRWEAGTREVPPTALRTLRNELRAHVRRAVKALKELGTP